MTPNNPEILILGAGWTSTFLIPLLTQNSISWAATTTTGHSKTLKFSFSYDTTTQALTPESHTQLASLPSAKTVLVTFPLRGQGRSKALIEAYNKFHQTNKTQWIQLGSSGIFQPGEISGQGVEENKTCWITRHSKYDKSNDRAIAEDELLELGGCVLNLSGLWGGERQPKNWIDRVAATKEKLSEKRSLHMVHGRDVARAILGVHQQYEKAKGERFVSLLAVEVVRHADLMGRL
jgi:hypothetical protein